MDNVLTTLFLHLVWRMRDVRSMGDAATDVHVKALADMQQAIVEKLTDIVIGDASNARDAIKESVRLSPRSFRTNADSSQAFAYLLDLYALFHNIVDSAADGQAELYRPLRLDFDETTPFRLAGFLQAEIDRYLELLGFQLSPDKADASGSETEQGTTDADEDDAAAKAKKRKKAAAKKPVDEPAAAPRTLTEQQLAAQTSFRRIVSAFVRTINIGVLDVRHAAVVLTHFQRFDGFFDQSARLLVDVLRARGIHGDQGAECASVIIESLRDVRLVLWTTDGVL